MWKREIHLSLLLLTMISLAGCGHLNKAIKEAGARTGKVEAEKKVPEYPEYCRLKSRSGVRVGQALAEALLLTDLALDNQNRRTEFCANWYDNVKNGFEKQNGQRTKNDRPI